MPLSRDAARDLIVATLVAGVARLTTETTFGEPRWTFDGLSPCATTQHEGTTEKFATKSGAVEVHEFSVWLYVLADRDASGAPSDIEALAEPILNEMAGQARSALSGAGFSVGRSDGTPKDAPWRKFGGLRYRAERIALTYIAF